MSFGHFAAGFADAFGESMLQKQEQDRLDKMAKLQGQLLELQIKAGERVQDAQTQVTDMMAGNQLGQFNIQPDQGLGQFNIQSQPGPDGRMQTPQFEQTEGMNLPPQAQGMEKMSIDQVMQDPEGLSALMASGWLDMSDLIGGGARSNATLEMMNAAGIDPASPEGRDLIEKKIAGTPDDLMTRMMLQIQMGQEQERLAGLRRNRELEEKTERQRVAGTKVDAKKDFRHAREAFEIQKELEQTALASGIPYGEFLTALSSGGVALMGTMGFDVSKQQDLIAKRRRLEKLFADGTLNALDRFAGTGAVGRDKFAELQKSTPSILVPSQANSLLFADRLEAMLSAADIEQIDIDEREDIESFIEELRSYSPAGPETVVDVRAIASATKEELTEMSKTLTDPELIQAAADRWEELNARK